MAQTRKRRFVAQWYESDESMKGPYAVTPDERQWMGVDPVNDLTEAVQVCTGWIKTGVFKSCRVVEVDNEGQPTSVVWASAWEAPIKATVEQGSSGTPGESLKLHVWMDKTEGPPDHWDWNNMLQRNFDGNNNAWDVEYAREVATRGRQVCYTIKLNLWPVAKKPVVQWNWWKIFGKDPIEQQDEVEVIRAHEIEPRSFPSGVDTVDCAWCGKTHVKSLSWRAYNNETDEYEQFDRCRCIDDKLGDDVYRINPDQDEFEGCPAKGAMALN